MANTNMWKVLWINDMNFVQEKNFTTETAARTELALHSQWAALLKIVIGQTITDVTTP